MRTNSLLLCLTVLMAGNAAAIDSSKMPPVLGGVVRSDQWDVHTKKGEKEEIFTGHVSYKNPSYDAKSDRATYKHNADIITMTGNVTIKAKDKNGAASDISAGRIEYFRKSGQSYIYSEPKAPAVRIQRCSESAGCYESASKNAFYDEKNQVGSLSGGVDGVITRPDGTLIKTYSDYAEFHENTATGILTAEKGRSVHIFHTDKDGTTSTSSNSAVILRDQEKARLEGNVHIFADKMTASGNSALYDYAGKRLELNGDVFMLADGNMRARADSSVYTQDGRLDLRGGRPVMWGSRERYDFAIQADELTVVKGSRDLKARNKVRGWIRPVETAGDKNATKF